MKCVMCDIAAEKNLGGKGSAAVTALPRWAVRMVPRGDGPWPHERRTCGDGSTKLLPIVQDADAGRIYDCP